MSARTGFRLGLVGLVLVCLTSAGLAAARPNRALAARGESQAAFAQNPSKTGERTVWDGVYTAEQADRGKALYTQSCAGCHSADLRGNGTAPSLVEGDFAFQWADTSVGKLYEQIRTLMPSTRPNSLGPQSYGDIVAYILQANQFPEGQTELAPELATLEQIRITAKPKP
jgi:mono/diheme cytochrome c family protein